jgi:8-oxo-dGTP pyrophosphatase MutT (NUDIX family)
MDGLFSLAAGALEAGETIATAASREAQEELGVRLVPSSMRHAHTLHSLTDRADWVGHFFVATGWLGVPTLCEPGKHADLTWRPLHDLPGDLIPYVRQALTCIAAGIPYSEFGWPDQTPDASP